MGRRLLSCAAVLVIGLMNTVQASTHPIGCYMDSSTFAVHESYPYQSVGYCLNKCTNAGASFAGLHNGNECWCGESKPLDSDLTSDAKCNVPCAAWPVDMCGGSDAWSVYKVPKASPTSTSVIPGTSSSVIISTPSPSKTGTDPPSVTPTVFTGAANRGPRILFF